MTDVAEIARGLTKAQREAVYPGPGNPDYARGPAGSMKKLEDLGVVKQVNAFSTNGKRGALLTAFGASVRDYLKEQG